MKTYTGFIMNNVQESLEHHIEKIKDIVSEKGKSANNSEKYCKESFKEYMRNLESAILEEIFSSYKQYVLAEEHPIEYFDTGYNLAYSLIGIESSKDLINFPKYDLLTQMVFFIDDKPKDNHEKIVLIAAYNMLSSRFARYSEIQNKFAMFKKRNLDMTFKDFIIRQKEFREDKPVLNDIIESFQNDYKSYFCNIKDMPDEKNYEAEAITFIEKYLIDRKVI